MLEMVPTGWQELILCVSFQFCSHWPHIGSFKSVMVEAFTPKKLANSTNQGFLLLAELICKTFGSTHWIKTTREKLAVLFVHCFDSSAKTYWAFFCAGFWAKCWGNTVEWMNRFFWTKALISGGATKVRNHHSKLDSTSKLGASSCLKLVQLPPISERVIHWVPYTGVSGLAGVCYGTWLECILLPLYASVPFLQNGSRRGLARIKSKLKKKKKVVDKGGW